MTSKLLMAGAGAGKTTWLVNQALTHTGKVLITTFTVDNAESIRKKLYEINGCIPHNIVILPWFTFLLTHGVKPYQGAICDIFISGLLLVNSKSGLKCKLNNGRPIYYPESDPIHFYFNEKRQIFSDKIAKFVVSANDKTQGLVFERIKKIFPNIYVDEIQDLAGYDLEIIKKLHKAGVNLLMVGDPRQVTYHTHNESKNKKYNDGRIKEYITEHCKKIEIDTKTLNKSYRNHPLICNYANRLYPDMPPCESCSRDTSDHNGIFLVTRDLVESYINKYQPIQLRDKRNVDVNDHACVMNFGESKGLTFDRVLIYPTVPMKNWLANTSSELKPESRSKLYVAITRARFSVAFVVDTNDNFNNSGIDHWHAVD